MSRANSDRNLLFGVLAMQMDFITREALVAAVSAWVLDKERPLELILVEQGALSATRRAILGPLVDEHVKVHDDDPGRSLASVSSIGSVREDLARVADPDFAASLDVVGSLATRMVDAYATRPPSVGTTTSSGLRFRVLRPHDRGGLGIVSVARDEELHREVALKEIQDQHADDPEKRSRFLLEAEITGGLEHPGIVPVYGLGHYEDGRPFYAMRFIKGDSLKHAIARFHEAESPGREPGERALRLRELLGRFVDVCNAMAYAHSRGVLHRDLKPGNIMLGPFGETLVVDWGLAKTVDGPPDSIGPGDSRLRPQLASGSAATIMGSAIGTPAYMSPEQAEGHLDRLGPASDVYSLGATLFHLLTGRVPFDDKDIGLLLQKVIRGDFPTPRRVNPKVAPALEGVCLKAMARDSKDRYPSPLALAEDLKAWLAGEPVSAYREPWIARAGRWARRHKTPVAGAASLMATAVVALVISGILLRNEKGRTEHQRDLAQKNFQQARKAVDDSLSRVAEDPQLKLPGLQPLRKRLLETALTYYKGFARVSERPDDQAGLADAQIRAGLIHALIGSSQESLTDFGDAVAIYDALAIARPDDSEVKGSLATALNHLGDAQLAIGKPAEALRSYDRSLEIREKLAAARPDDPGVLGALATSLASLGEWQHKAGDRPKSLEFHRKALDLFEKIAARDPAAVTPRVDLARGLTNLGSIRAEQRQFDEALLVLRRARDIRQGLVRDDPENPDLRQALAENYHSIAAILHTNRQLDEAMTSFVRARELREELVGANTVAEYQDQLAKDQNDIGLLQQERGRLDDALQSHQKAHEIRAQLVRFHANVPQYRRGRAESLIALGKLHAAGKRADQALKSYEEARVQLEDLVREQPGEAMFRLYLALDYESIGNLALGAGKTGDALPPLQKAREIREGLVREHPDDSQFQSALSNSYANLGVLRASTGSVDEAIGLLRQARDLRARVVAGSPEDVNTRSSLAVILENLGTWLDRSGHRPEALDSFRDALDHQRRVFKKAPESAQVRRLLGMHCESLARVQRASGKPAEAVATTLERQAIWPDDPNALYQSARELALCLPIAGLPEPDQVAGRAVEALSRAVDKGFRDLSRLQDDPDLAPLRARGDFGRLLEQAREKVKSTGDPAGPGKPTP